MDERLDNIKEELSELDADETTEEKETEAETEADTKEEGEKNTEGEEATEETTEEPTYDPEEEAKLPEKLRGKSRLEMAEIYQNLEKSFGSRTLNKEERKDLKDQGLTPKDVREMDEATALLENTDFSKITDAKDFAKTIIDITDKKAEAKAREIYQNASSVKQAVRTELNQAYKEYPLLKTNDSFRKMTLAIIEAGASRKESITLADAARQVTAFIGQNKAEAEKVKADEEKAKKAEKDKKDTERASVETPGGANLNTTESDEDEVRKGLMGASQNGSPLGGLGI